MARDRGSKSAAARRAALPLLLALAACCAAQEANSTEQLKLRNEFWIELAPRPEFEVDPLPFDPAEATKGILSEAAYVYAGMIRGFTVLYLPYDKARGIEERLEVEPMVADSIPIERLVRGPWRVVKNDFRAYVEYVPDANERALYSSWRSVAYPTSDGEGKAPWVPWSGNRIKAIQDGIKEAVREYARTKVWNKPRLVRALAVLERPPTVSVRAGNYVARVRIRLRVEEILPYSAY